MGGGGEEMPMCYLFLKNVYTCICRHVVPYYPISEIRVRWCV